VHHCFPDGRCRTRASRGHAVAGADDARRERWIRLQRETLEALASRKAQHGLHTFDDTVRELL